MNKRVYAKLAALLMAAGISGAQAVTITQYGPNVKFTYDDATLFGTGTIVGNNIFFTPADFVAHSVNGTSPAGGHDVLTATLDITVESLDPDNFLITNAQLTESGDYQLEDYGSAGAPAVRARATLGGAGVSPITGNAFATSDSFDTGLLDTPTTAGAWSGTAKIGNFGVPYGHATTLDLTIENVLDAFTYDNGDLANIAKKFAGSQIGVEINPNPVPVPAAAWLFGSGLLGMVAVARRRETTGSASR